MVRFVLRRAWRYQRGNQNQNIAEQTTQRPKEKVQKDKQRSIKHTYKTKDRVTRTSLKTGGELWCTGSASMFIYGYWCFTRFLYHTMFVSTTATYKTSNTFLPTPEHTSSHHRSAVSHEFTSPLSRVTRVHIIAQPCSC
jgi:hypothetical protein